MWIENLPPFVPFFIAAIFAGLLTGKGRLVLLLVPVWGALNMHLTLDAVSAVNMSVLGFQLGFLNVDKLALMFGYLFHIAAFISLIYSLHVEDKTQQVAGLLYAGCALGAVFAADFISLFIFWELLALTSVFLVWARRTQSSLNAGIRYLIMQVLSGVLLLAGAIMLAQQGKSLDIDYVGLEGTASWLLLIAFGIKAAFPFMHTWLTDAYPAATPTGTVFLSAFTPTVALYALARHFPGAQLALIHI